MPQTEKRDAGLRMLGSTFGALALWLITYIVASRILSRPSSNVTLRAAAVIIGVLGFVLWQLATARLIRLHDEFTRLIHLIALGVAFAGTGLFIFVIDLLQRAGFVDYILLRTIWMVMLGTWWLALMVARWYYRR